MSKLAANRYSKIKQGHIKGGFAVMRFDVIDSPAFAYLSGNAVKVFLILKRAFNGKNNGEIVMSCRMISKVAHMSRATASRALTELQKHGFIRVVKPGWYAGHIATIWELTDTRNNQSIAKETDLWRQWQPETDCRALDPDYCGLVSPDKNQNKVPFVQQSGTDMNPSSEVVVAECCIGVS